MGKKSLHDRVSESIAGALTLVRVDFNVPLGNDGRILDDIRLVRTLPTLRHLVDARAKIILLSHLGRPKGMVKAGLSLRGVSLHLEELLGVPVTFCPKSTGTVTQAAVEELGEGEILLLENTRFQSEELENDMVWAESLRHGAKLFVNDAFGSAHRAHASTVGIANTVRAAGGEALAGLLMERELRFLGETLADPVRPFVAVIGGAKISGKIDVIEALLPRVDLLLIGGAMANTFFLAQGLCVGKSLVERDSTEIAEGLLERAGDRILLPTDVVTAESLKSGATTRETPCGEVCEDECIGDIGSRSVRRFAKVISGASTVVWNGPMGVFEVSPFEAGTFAVARAAASAADKGGVVVLGGGDSAAAARASGIAHRMTHISTGGGATLEFLSGKELPGVVALSDRIEESEIRTEEDKR
ncbi:MAG: phosphoglycerate kinase [Gemmatimonadota bacterium]|nr:phosphoglycerate kinase [Gemmatimonadota bacterium]